MSKHRCSPIRATNGMHASQRSMSCIVGAALVFRQLGSNPSLGVQVQSDKSCLNLEILNPRLALNLSLTHPTFQVSFPEHILRKNHFSASSDLFGSFGLPLKGLADHGGVLGQCWPQKVWTLTNFPGLLHHQWESLLKAVIVIASDMLCRLAVSMGLCQETCDRRYLTTVLVLTSVLSANRRGRMEKG